MARSTTSFRRASLDEPLHRRTDADDGKTRILPRWVPATHMFNQATVQSRDPSSRQLAILMKQLVIDPGVTDLPCLAALYDGTVLNAPQM